MKLLLSVLAATGLLWAQACLAAPTKGNHFWERATNAPTISRDFPDPSILKAKDGSWYAFGTTSNGKQVQVATALYAEGPWSYLDTDALPDPGNWTTGSNTWAPDVRQMEDDTYVMYYSGEVASNPAFHCVGTATSEGILGPYKPSSEPFACDLSIGGQIDPSGFRDHDGTQYVVYKVDGNSIGHGGSCNNDVSPFLPTPLLLQEVDEDGITKVGDPIQLLDRTDADGPLVEAPALLRHDNGVYTLFFSSGCFTEPTYNINYATAHNIKGPYTRSSTPLVRSDDSFGLTAPGGATPTADGDMIVFHADCSAGRCLFESKIDIMGDDVVLDGVDGIGS